MTATLADLATAEADLGSEDDLPRLTAADRHPRTTLPDEADPALAKTRFCPLPFLLILDLLG